MSSSFTPRDVDNAAMKKPYIQRDYSLQHLVELNDVLLLGSSSLLGTSGLDGVCLWWVVGLELDLGVCGCSGNSGLSCQLLTPGRVNVTSTSTSKRKGCDDKIVCIRRAQVAHQDMRWTTRTVGIDIEYLFLD